MPPPLPDPLVEDDVVEVEPAVPVIRTWLRCLLAGLGLLLVALFGVAIALNPYYGDGTARHMETHRQLGLPECTFKTLTGKPCPSCGMTTSFALLIRGDVLHSLQANWVGTALASFLLVLIPWSLACALRGRLMWVLSLEWAVTRFIVVFVVLMLVRWGIVLLLLE